jgi:hypothetical protein
VNGVTTKGKLAKSSEGLKKNLVMISITGRRSGERFYTQKEEDLVKSSIEGSRFYGRKDILQWVQPH